MKIISVLFFPYQNNLVVKVTRAEGFFTYPQQVRVYSMSYDSPMVSSLFYWYQQLQRLVENKIFISMKDGK